MPKDHTKARIQYRLFEKRIFPKYFKINKYLFLYLCVVYSCGSDARGCCGGCSCGVDDGSGC